VKNLFSDGEGWWSLNCDGVDGPTQFRDYLATFLLPRVAPRAIILFLFYICIYLLINTYA